MFHLMKGNDCLNKLICLLIGHNYQFDKWQAYYPRHKRCQRCGKWE